MNVIETFEATKRFKGRTVVDRVSLAVPKGSIYGILGANGAGKSTLLRLLVGLFGVTSGEVYAFGQPVQSNPKDLYQRIHYVASESGMYADLRVGEMLKISESLYSGWDKQFAERLIEEFGLSRRQVIKNLSTGMRAQLQMTIALSSRPEVLVLDEATNGLDPLVKHQIIQLLIETAASNEMTIVFATHQLDEIERLADHVAMMVNGRIVAAQNTDDLRANVREIQFISQSEIPDPLLAQPGIHRVNRRGEHWSIVTDGEADGWVDRLRESGAEHIAVHELDMRDMFRFFMEREGYQRDRIHLP